MAKVMIVKRKVETYMILIANVYWGPNMLQLLFQGSASYLILITTQWARYYHPISQI